MISEARGAKNSNIYGIMNVEFNMARQRHRNMKIRIYKIMILPAVLYGCETCSLTLRVEHRLRVFENRVLRRIFGPKRD
jgi:hypothetical protein